MPSSLTLGQSFVSASGLEYLEAIDELLDRSSENDIWALDGATLCSKCSG